LLDQPAAIHRPDLVEHNLPTLSLEPAWHAFRIRLSLRGHRRDNHYTDMQVQIRLHQIDLESADYDRHSVSSHLVEVGASRSASSPRSAVLAKAASHPVLE